MMERSFREAMMIGHGELSTFLTRPISASLLVVGIVVIAVPSVMATVRRGHSRQAFSQS